MTKRLSFVTENHQLHPSRLGPNRLCQSIFGATHGRNHARTIGFVWIIEPVCDRIRRMARHQPHAGCSPRPERPRTFPIA